VRLSRKAILGIATVLVVAGCSSTSVALNSAWFNTSDTPLPRTVFSVLRGSPHCSDRDNYWILMGWPIGHAGDARNAATIRSFERGSPPQTVARPAGIVYAGYHLGGYALWTPPAGGDQAVFVVHGGRTEKWVRAPTVPVCQ
jgi:hypothetical protein